MKDYLMDQQELAAEMCWDDADAYYAELEAKQEPVTAN
jgi:hypothetical protein